MCMCVHVFVCKGDCWKQKTCLRIKRKSLPRLPSCCLVAQLCWTVCDPMDYSSPGSSVHEISQATILEWIAISFSRSCYMMYFASILWIIWKREEWSDMKEVDACSGILVGGELRRCIVNPEGSQSECKQFRRAEPGVRLTHTGLVKNSFGFFYNILQENLNKFLAKQ